MNDINFNDYQSMAWQYRAWPYSEVGNLYPILGLAEEAGEVAGKVGKAIREGVGVDKVALKKELGDVLWQLSAISTLYDFDLEDIAISNLTKLEDRYARGVIVGSGDDR